ncbi:MAG TPA: Arm DNA-binding domain-containing protein [Rhodanobacteraceae bacterium]|nr:Arm DNA-binding domain-containing protein [Rhodanobacteraceae bacterium]
MGDLIDKAIRTALKRARTTGRMVRESDGEWPTLLVTSAGVARWQQRYRYGGKERSISFGSYPTLSLAEGIR